MGLRQRAAALWAAGSGRAVLWLPVAYGTGVWIYFALPAEPSPLVATAPLPLLAALLSGWPRRRGALALGATLAAFAVAAGLATALVHARAAAGPVLPRMIEATVDGRVVEIGRAASGAPRALLEAVRIAGVEPGDTPLRLRIALVETTLAEAPAPGRRIRLHARLFPPGGPVEPGGFDFRRAAHFERVGGVGYALGPILALAPDPAATATDRLRLGLGALRARIADALRTALPGPEGAFAAAILVGDRAGIEAPEEEALRAANLSHLLAISGLHMGLLCGLVFAATRLAVAAVPALALAVSGKKAAAAAALLAGAGYLVLSGATVPTQRAFAMAAVALVAVLIDRPAITLRALALAAIVVLALRPVSLLDPGFQMSFAATAALVAAFERMRRGPGAGPPRRRGVARRVLLYVGGIAATSAVAGLATAPFAVHHFNRLAVWGLPANLLALPLMGLWIAPAAALAALLAPLGLADAPVALMGIGIAGVLEVTRTVADWPGAVWLLPSAPGPALGLMALGGLWLLLWRGALRLAGLAGVLAALGLWADAPARPEVLIAPGARLVGVLGPEGRVIDHPRAQGFTAERWLEADGDGADQAAAAARPGMTHGRGWARAAFANGWRLEVRHAARPDPAMLAGLCEAGVLLVARHGPPVEGACCYLGEAALDALGAVAVRMTRSGPALEAAGGGRRLWDPAPAGPPPALSNCG